MKYRVQVPAVIMFTVKAASRQEAIKMAEAVRNYNDVNGWDIDLSLDGEELDGEGRAYIDSDCLRAPLTDSCIVDEYDDE